MNGCQYEGGPGITREGLQGNTRYPGVFPHLGLPFQRRPESTCHKVSQPFAIIPPLVDQVTRGELASPPCSCAER